jgi:hypothetical protein
MYNLSWWTFCFLNNSEIPGQINTYHLLKEDLIPGENMDLNEK